MILLVCSIIYEEVKTIEKLIEKSSPKPNIDKETYSKLVVSIYDDLLKTAKYKLGDEEDAKDVLQDTIMIAYLNFGKLRNEKYFKTWITKILINQCNKYYKKKYKEMEVFDDFSSADNVVSYMDEPAEYESIVNLLNEREKKIFDLYYDNGFSIKDISKRLNLKENTVKSILSRGREKIKKKYKPFTLAVFILCLFVATTVIAISVISYIQDMFRVERNGETNDGVLEAIETLGWFQKSDMDYVDLGNGYKVKLDYFLLDEMSLYLVLDLESEKDLSKYDELSLIDLKIENENGDLICDESNTSVNQYKRLYGEKTIKKESNSIKQLIYMYTDSFPTSNTLNLNFSRLGLHKNSLFDKGIEEIYANINLSLEISEKFKNRNHISYSSPDSMFKKALISETGFYAIVSLDSIGSIDAKLIDESGNEYSCFTSLLNSYDEDNFAIEYIIVSNYNDKNSENLKLIIDGKEYLLNKL